MDNLKIEGIIYSYSVLNKSINKISEETGYCQRKISKILHENGVEIKSNSFYLSKYIDVNFFKSIDSEEKSYVLGWMYSDGYVSGKHFGIKVSIRDIEILKKIKLCMKSEHKIIIGTNNNGYGIGNKYCLLSVVNENMVNDLINLGVVYNKSKVLKFPSNNQVPAHLLNHFIRGCFDGDGSITKTSSNGGLFGITGTKDFLNGVLNEFHKFLNTNVKPYAYKELDNIYDIKIGGKNQIRKIYDYLYNNATIFLGRKKDKFEDILQIK